MKGVLKLKISAMALVLLVMSCGLFSTLEIRFFFFETNFVKVLIPFIGVRRKG